MSRSTWSESRLVDGMETDGGRTGDAAGAQQHHFRTHGDPKEAAAAPSFHAMAATFVAKEVFFERVVPLVVARASQSVGNDKVVPISEVRECLSPSPIKTKTKQTFVHSSSKCFPVLRMTFVNHTRIPRARPAKAASAPSSLRGFIKVSRTSRSW